MHRDDTHAPQETKAACLFPAFPVFHQTFVLWEMLELRRNGVRPKIYSLWQPSVRQQPEGREIIPEVTYLPRAISLAVLRSNVRLLLGRPLRYIDLYVELVRAWRSGAVIVERLPSAGARATLYNRLRGWWKTGKAGNKHTPDRL